MWANPVVTFRRLAQPGMSCCWRTSYEGTAAERRPIKSANADVRVTARGSSSIQANTRSTLSAIAVRRFCRWVFACPI